MAAFLPQTGHGHDFSGGPGFFSTSPCDMYSCLFRKCVCLRANVIIGGEFPPLRALTEKMIGMILFE